ncbi:MAG: GNAT family N-acetyltransferase, partial [Actinomycetes bacterium]
FLTGLGRPSPQLVARLLLRDDRHGAWLAVDHREFVVGHVLWALDAEVVDLGVVVADAWQGRGVGRQLIQVAMSEATAAGARAVEVDVHLENRRMLRLLRTILPGATVTYEADLVTLQASLAAPRRKIA